MDEESIFTRRRFGIDVNVLLVMLVAILLSVGLVSYKLIGSNKKCLPFAISTSGYNNEKNNVFLLGKTVQFNASLPNGSNIVWDAGDGTPTIRGNNSIHVFRTAGEFTITAVENGQCSQTLSIVIKAPLVNIDPEPLIFEEIVGNKMPIVGALEQYTCNIKANTYEWSVPSSTKIETKRGKSVSYQFPLAQQYELQVKLDNNPSKIYRIAVFVTAANKNNVPEPTEVTRLVPPTGIPTNNNPPIKTIVDDDKIISKPTDNSNTKTENPIVPPTDPNPITPTNPEKPKTKYITVESFQSMLEDLVKGDGEIEDFTPYLAYGVKTKVWENGKWSNFADLFHHMKNKKIEIKKVVFHREENKNIQNIEIEYKKKSFIPGLF